MKIDKIILEFDAEELEAVHYAIEIGVRDYKRNKSTCANDWIEIAERIRQKLPTRLRMANEKWEKAGNFL